MNPFVTVVVPFYNGASTIRACAESIAALDYPNDRLEILFVDNGSTDDSASIVRRFPSIRVIEEKARRGSYAARNAAIRAASGEIFAFTDADCIVDRDWVKNGVRWLVAADGAAGSIRALEPRSLVEEFQVSVGMLSQSAAFKHPYLPYAQTANAFYKRCVFEAAGLFEAGWVSGGDADFSWRMQLDGSFRLTYAEDATVFHHHRSSPRGLYLQSHKNVIGACLLNHKYSGRFQSVPAQSRAVLAGKIALTRLASSSWLLRWRAGGGKESYFRYLMRVSRLGYLEGCREYLRMNPSVEPVERLDSSMSNSYERNSR